jgi:hypothetical protein
MQGKILVVKLSSDRYCLVTSDLGRDWPPSKTNAAAMRLVIPLHTQIEIWKPRPLKTFVLYVTGSPSPSPYHTQSLLKTKQASKQASHATLRRYYIGRQSNKLTCLCRSRTHRQQGASY